MARLAAGELFHIVNDHLGTPREMFSEGGDLAWRCCVTQTLIASASALSSPLPALSTAGSIASCDGEDPEQTAGDEIITWLSDDRASAKHLQESRNAPAPATAPVKF